MSSAPHGLGILAKHPAALVAWIPASEQFAWLTLKASPQG
jgi:hypothetical protein